MSIRPPGSDPVRILYTFPFAVGAGRICTTAWHQIAGVARTGAAITVSAASIARPLPDSVAIHRTLSWGRWRVPYRLIGNARACRLHDLLTARWLRRHAHRFDLVHGWPSASLRTFAVARHHRLPCLIERPNAHTAYAYEATAQECRRLGITLPADHDHHYNAALLALEQREYDAADFLLCPSEFVQRTFTERGFATHRLLRHHYGYDTAVFQPATTPRDDADRFTLLYAGVCEPRKGLHYALRAWHDSGAAASGVFRICGAFVPHYREKLAALLDHPSIEVLGHRNDLPALMARSDAFILPSVEEGSALVTYEARGAGCVLLVSDAAGAVCEHNHNALVHPMRDVATLTRHLAALIRDRALLVRLRQSSLADRNAITWSAAGTHLATLYTQTITPHPANAPEP